MLLDIEDFMKTSEFLFSWIIGFSHFYMCKLQAFSFFLFSLIQLPTWERRSWTKIQWLSLQSCRGHQDLENTLGSRKDGWIVTALLTPDIHERNADGWRFKKKKKKSVFLWLMQSWQWGSLRSNCSVFVLSFCQSILLSRDLYLEWVWGKMTINYKWWL